MRQFTEDSKISSLKHISACACKVSCIQLFADPRTVAHQAPLFIGFSRQEYWSGLPYPPPGNLPDLGIEMSLVSLALTGGFFTTVPTGKPWLH